MDLPDFDQLLQLAKNQPDALESLRTTLISALIDKAQAETKHRLRGLQFQIDAQRQCHKTPLGACIKISSMMNSSFHNMIEQLNQPVTHEKPQQKAKILKLELMGSNQ